MIQRSRHCYLLLLICLLCGLFALLAYHPDTDYPLNRYRLHNLENGNKPITVYTPNFEEELPPTEPIVPISILFFVKYRLYKTLMDRQFFFRYEGALNHTLVKEVAIWGPGWLGYNETRSMSQNVVDKYGFNHFNLIYQWSSGVTTDVGPDTVIALELGDCWENKSCLNGILPDTHMIMQPVAYYADWMEESLSKTRLIGHLPFCIDPYFFYRPVEPIPKRHKVLLIGAVYEVYPLRQRLRTLGEEGKIPVDVRPHPSYPDLYDDEKLLSFGINVSEKDAMYKPMRNHQDTFLVRQIVDYVLDIQSSMMVAFDASRFKIPLKKFWEALMAGVPIISDMPNEFEEELSKVVYRVDTSMSDEEIVSRVNTWLNNPKDLMRRAKYGQKLAMKYFTCEKSITNIVEYYHKYKRGSRGVFFKLPFSKTCYALNADGTKVNDWCVPATK